jgi:hypothetical protein
VVPGSGVKEFVDEFREVFGPQVPFFHTGSLDEALEAAVNQGVCVCVCASVCVCVCVRLCVGGWALPVALPLLIGNVWAESPLLVYLHNDSRPDTNILCSR